MKLGTNDIGSVYLGTNAVQKVYLGTNEVWSSWPGYVLDDYPSAAAAYSLRLLRSTYTGSAIRVRRASDNTEQNIGFVNNELDTSSLTTFCSGTDGFITTWYDQSGNGYNATQTTASNQPTIVVSGVFNGYILQNNKVLTTSLPYTNTQSYTNFTVIKQTGGAVIGATANTGSVFYAVSDTSGASSFQNFSNVSYYKNGALISGTLRNSIYNAILNQKVVLTSFATNNNTQNMTIGYPSYAAYQINEIIIYASNQSTNQNGIETNIKTYYGL
jgi:hypothetical protein